MGATSITAEQVEDVVEQLSASKFVAVRYNRLQHNCVDFAQELCSWLGVANSVPSWCQRGLSMARFMNFGGDKPNTNGLFRAPRNESQADQYPPPTSESVSDSDEVPYELTPRKRTGRPSSSASDDMSDSDDIPYEFSPRKHRGKLDLPCSRESTFDVYREWTSPSRTPSKTTWQGSRESTHTTMCPETPRTPPLTPQGCDIVPETPSSRKCFSVTVCPKTPRLVSALVEPEAETEEERKPLSVGRIMDERFGFCVSVPSVWSNDGCKSADIAPLPDLIPSESYPSLLRSPGHWPSGHLRKAADEVPMREMCSTTWDLDLSEIFTGARREQTI